jgi:hypothetical protein
MSAGFMLTMKKFLIVSNKHKCLKCSNIAEKKQRREKESKFVKRFLKADGTLYDTLNFRRALQSLSHTYSDLDFVENELLAGRQVQTALMLYELSND